MLTIKIQWPSDFGVYYTVHTTKHYIVTELQDHTKQLILNNINPEDIHDIRLGPGTTVYVMNDAGSTVDIIRV